MFKRNLPKKADIYMTPRLRKNKLRLAQLKPKTTLKITGAVALTFFLFFGFAALFTSAQTTYKELANSFMPSTTSVSTIADTATNNRDDNNNDNGDKNGFNYNYTYSGNGYNGSNFNYYTAPLPSARFINTVPVTPVPNNNFNFNSTNLAGLSGQIASLQQQIGNTMQSCVNNARQGANQILNMKNQAKQLQTALDNLNNQAGQIDTSTPAGQQRQQQMQNQAQQMQNQLDNLNTNIGNIQDQYNTNTDRCKQNVSQLEQNRDDAEGKLDDAFNQAMNISTDLPN
jgi:hypothetical protein